MTPRKTRQRHQNSNAQSNPIPIPIQASDYESEAFYASPVPTRSNTELNLSVLRRHHPSIQSILSIAPSTQIYTFLPETSSWNKTEIEGTLFVCQLAPASLAGTVQHCIVVMNRRGLDNLILNLAEVVNVEITEEFLMLAVGNEEGEGMKTMGFYIHADKSDTREVNCRLIKEKWEEAMSMGDGEADVPLPMNGAAVGRRLSLTDLFR